MTQRFRVITDHPVAVDSPDHVNPYGVKYNNSHNQDFNDKLYELFPKKPLRLLDIGCAGGHSVMKFNEQGHYAIGLEGSDYRLKHKLPEWDKDLPYLFLCDVTKPFKIEELIVDYEEDFNDGRGGFAVTGYQEWEQAKFNVITSWEFLEHLNVTDLPNFYDKIKEYLAPGGAWIVSICVFDDERSKRTYGKEWGPKELFKHVQCCEGFGLHHQWCVPREWWYENLTENGFHINDEKLAHFEGKFVRGPGIEAGEDCTINLYLEVK